MKINYFYKMPQESKDIRLVVEISNTNPIELIDFTKSFLAIANQFGAYVRDHGDSTENREAKLYVTEVREGSVIFELKEYATIGLIPFLENINTITGFAGYLKDAYNYILGKTEKKPKELTVNDYKELSQIINPIAKDRSSQYNISTKVDGNLELHFHTTGIEANAIQNIVNENSKLLGLPNEADGIKTSVLLRFFQTRSDIKAKSGNKGIIEDFDSKPKNIVFNTPELNKEMLHGDYNPYETVYVVDVILQNIGGELYAYKIVKLHETLDLNED